MENQEIYETCLACQELKLNGEFHPCDHPENCTDAECPIGATMVGWPHPIEDGCSCFNKPRELKQKPPDFSSGS